MKKLNPQVFEKAATAILSGDHDFCCCAIDSEEFSDRRHGDGPHMKFFECHFKPAGCDFVCPWWNCLWAEELDWYQQREARIIALLLSAEMCKSK